MRKKALILDEKAIGRTLTRISFEIIEKNRGAHNLCIIGIMQGGVAIASRIAEKIAENEGINVELGFLDITPHRDDRDSGSGDDGSRINFTLRDKQVVLVDDVLFTGRSVRAAIDAIMSRGRPQSIQLAVLVDRGHRELPIRPDYIGKNIPTSQNEIITVETKEHNGADAVYIMEM